MGVRKFEWRIRLTFDERRMVQVPGVTEVGRVQECRVQKSEVQARKSSWWVAVI